MNAKQLLACLVGATFLYFIAPDWAKPPVLPEKVTEEINDAQALALAQVERDGLAAIKTMEARGWKAVDVDIEKEGMRWRFVKDSTAVNIRTQHGRVYAASAEFYSGD